MCLNRMWLAENLEESWIFSTNSLFSETLSDEQTAKERENKSHLHFKKM